MDGGGYVEGGEEMKQLTDTTWQSDNGLITFILGDCMQFMAGCKENEFQLAVVDPPYGIGAGNKNFINRNTANKKAEKFYRDNDWDKCRPTQEYFNELKRVSKNYIIWGGNYFVDLLEPARCYIVWDKKTGDNSYADCELALTNIDSNAKIYTKFWLGAHATNKIERIHPTEKPIELYRWIFKNYAKPTDHIFDSHGGSMSSAIAAHMEGLRMTIIELDPEYFHKAIQRFATYEAQQTIKFD